MKNYIKIFLLSVFAVAACSEVQIPQVPVASVQINKNQLTLTKGKTFVLSVSMLPEEATDKSIVWKSTKESVATVTPDGLVTAVGYGTSYIVATNPASSLTAACMVTVEMKGPYQVVVNAVGGGEVPQTVYGYPGMTLALEAASTDGEDHIYEWASSATDCISVQDGLLSWKNQFASSDVPSGYLLYAESQIEVKAEDGTSTSFTAVSNVLSTFGLNDVSRLAGTALKFNLSESRTVQIYAKTNAGTAELPHTLYSLRSSDNSIVEAVMTSEGWKLNAFSTNGTAEIVLTIGAREFTLATIIVEEYIPEPDKEYESGNTEKFPVDGDIDWEIEEENQENQ